MVYIPLSSQNLCFPEYAKLPNRVRKILVPNSQVLATRLAKSGPQI